MTQTVIFSKWIRSYVSFWVIGLCNNYGYVVMLSAAYDILQQFDSGHVTTLNSELNVTDQRLCHDKSTGTILLANIVPSVCIKMIAPFFPFSIHLRVMITIVLAIAGYILVASQVSYLLVIAGVICQSASSGLGETTYLGFLHEYNDNNIITSWSSGTGGAGIVGSLTYAGLTTIGLSPSTTIYCMLIVPVLMGIFFWIVLQKPDKTPEQADTQTSTSPFKDKLELIPRLFYAYMLPLCLVYYFEYLINQGLFELLDFPSAPLTKEEQYRWYNFTYQVGVFLSRTSMFLVQFNFLWVMGILQGMNVIIFLMEAIYGFVPHISIIFILIVWEGLLGGGAYVNTFRRIATEIPPKQREFSMSFTTLSDSLFISFAGLTAIPVHNAICKLPLSLKMNWS